MTDVVGSSPQYNVFADEFLDHARDGFYNAHYDRSDGGRHTGIGASPPSDRGEQAEGVRALDRAQTVQPL